MIATTSEDSVLLDYFFGGVLANLPLWVYILFSPTLELALITAFDLIVLGLIGGILAGYVLTLKSKNRGKYMHFIVGSLAFFASVLVLESYSIVLDVLLWPSFIVGVYLGKKIYERYSVKTDIKTSEQIEVLTEQKKRKNKENKYKKYFIFSGSQVSRTGFLE